MAQTKLEKAKDDHPKTLNQLCRIYFKAYRKRDRQSLMDEYRDASGKERKELQNSDEFNIPEWDGIDYTEKAAINAGILAVLDSLYKLQVIDLDPEAE